VDATEVQELLDVLCRVVEAVVGVQGLLQVSGLLMAPQPVEAMLLGMTGR
jgi:hypothetical protein